MENIDLNEQRATTLSSAAAEKAFRQQADIESFYRFVYENDLRSEALAILESTWEKKQLSRDLKSKKKH